SVSISNHFHALKTIGMSGKPARRLQRPPFAVFGPEIIGGLRAVGGPQERAVPLQLLSGAKSHIAEEHSLGQNTAISEIASRRAASFTGSNPFIVMAWRFGNGRRGWLKSRKLRF